MDKRIIVLIPAYEPTMILIDLLNELKKEKIEVVVVNDGSGIEYNDVFDKVEKYASLIEYDINKGKGAALKTGLSYIKDRFKDNYVVVTMDCDGQHSINDALKIGNYALEHNKELVLGKRVRSSKTPLRSRMGNSITRFFYRITTGLDVYDTQTGLRSFSSELIPFMIDVEGERFEYEMNMLLKCSLNKIKIKEIEIETIYIDNNSHSHFKAIRDSILVYGQIVKFLSSSIISFIVDYLMYSIILVLSNKLVISNVVARVISASVNYSLNKRYVFRDERKGYKQVIQYILLAILIIIINTIMLRGLVNYLDVNKYIAKVMVELLMLFISWIVQKKIIFKKII